MHSISEFFYNEAVFGVVLALLLAGGTLLPSDEFRKFKIARVCWWLLAVYLCGRVVMWSVLTDYKPHAARLTLVFLASGIIGVVCSEMARAIAAREDHLIGQQGEEKKSPPPVPPGGTQINQQGGTNSPIINNSPNSTITYNLGNPSKMDPKLKAKLDEIEQLIKSQNQGLNQAELLKKYPLGYVIFDIDRQSSVFPYATQSLLDRWEFDWSKVKVEEPQGQNVIWLTLPDIRRKSGLGLIMNGTHVGGPRYVGPIGSSILNTSEFNLRGEILSISSQGIVFLLGFDHPIPFHPMPHPAP